MTRPWSPTAAALVLALAGLGLLTWLGISVALLPGGLPEMEALRDAQARVLVLGVVLVLPVAWVLRHLPASRWRRAAIASLLCALAGTAAALPMLRGAAGDQGWLSLALALVCIGSISATLALGAALAARGHHAWRTQMIAPGLLAQALLAGAAVLFALIAMHWPDRALLASPVPSLVLLVLVAAALKQLYWHENGGLRAAAGHLDGRRALRWRIGVVSLATAVPLVVCAVIVAWPGASTRPGWWLIVASVLAGGYLEHLLLPVEARASPGRTPAALDVR